ncbi:hypothetical protein [Rickettsia typhi]|uniref:Uncharacterized protein n=2 Tax=Rickettsia typhi TaxID=785 RepID=Q68XK9_RICTY|nr:hypothetical protein [Rickettsia typhi]AAU03633.1 hypothetical protein RT0148 [Rickettsia typhi str. Wilmington]AFE54012.1 hypothetical protein RTTH1527_00725 [Rickettsia typhi str. TH1527]AFE54851.1 hypothetical protein RTB9991CWPP_00730 [Rickettsia typhi str. B9991CWPP]
MKNNTEELIQAVSILKALRILAYSFSKTINIITNLFNNLKSKNDII